MPGAMENFWSLLQLAKEPLAWKVFLSLVWENTRWYLMWTAALTVLTALLGWLYTTITGAMAGRTQSISASSHTSETEIQEPSSTTAASAEHPVEGEHHQARQDDGPLTVLVDTTRPLPPGRLKRAERDAMRRRLEQDMTDEQRRQERQSESEQMAAILDLMQKNSDKFGNLSAEDMQSQMRLYL